MFANHPPIYEEYTLGIPNYDNAFVEFRNEEILVGFPADSLVRVFDSNFDYVYSFGVKGREMKQNYPEAGDYDTYASIWEDAQHNYGYYYDMYFDESNNRLLRSYTKGNGTSGLQVFENDILVADFDVPKKFNLLGKIGDIYFASGLFDQNEELDYLGIYQFKIN